MIDNPILKRREDESEFDRKVRICIAKLNKEIDLDWSEIIDLLQLDCSADHLRKLSYAYKEMSDNLYNKQLESVEDDEFLDKLTQKKLELQKERAKLSAEKNEINKWIREQGRSELFYEKYLEILEKRQLPKAPNYIKPIVNSDFDWVLNFADVHYGKKVKINGLEDEILAEYNIDIFENRMWDLLNQIIHKVEKENINHLHLFNLGDSIDGILRMSQLQAIQLGINDALIGFADFMFTWLDELSNKVRIDYYSCWGNHDEIRPLGSSKGDFAHENVDRIITWHLQRLFEKTKNNNIAIHKNKPLYYVDIVGTKILATHGQDEKNLENSIKDYQNIYNKKIHVLFTGHLHNTNNKTVGMDGLQNIEIYQHPSICGIDDYSMKLKKAAPAGAVMMKIERDLGRTETFDFKLK
jgi:predicted phosphodiesterase